MAMHNDCTVASGGGAGSLPNINAAKLLRLASYLTKRDPDRFGTDPAAVTVDQVVADIYDHYAPSVKSSERDEDIQAAIDAVDDPEEF